MENLDGFVITPRDRILRAWQNATELVRDYRLYCHEWEKKDKPLSDLFGELAQNEAQHAARLLPLLQEHDRERGG